jgi:hypothetical protein
MLYVRRRALLALVLWAAAAVVAFLAVRSALLSPCASNNGLTWFLVGVGVLTAAAVLLSLPRTGFDRRGLAAALLAAGIGAVAGFALLVALFVNWVGHCTA